MPYTVERKSESGFNKIILKNTSTNILAEIIPSCGAILHAFTIWQNHHFINVIEQYDSAADFAAHVESKGMRSCKLSPFACRLKNGRYRFNEQEYKVDKYTLAEHAIHGLIYDAVFEVTKMEADKEKAIVELLYSYPGDNAGYPFKYDCTVRYTLKEGNALEISTEIVNKDNNAIPMQDGWHPYFRTGSKREDLELEFKSNQKIVFDDTLVPNGAKEAYKEFDSLKKIGDTFLDNCFTVNFPADANQPICILRDPVKKIQIEINPDLSYPYLQIYTPPGRDSIAIENLSAIPDAFNNGVGLITLPPQQKHVFTTTFKITPLK